MEQEFPAWAPTPQQVALRLKARTRQANGRSGEWTSETEPTLADVNGMIELVVQELLPRLGPVPERLQDQAQALATVCVAYKIELAYFPEQTETAMSPYKALYAEWCEQLKTWDKTATSDEPNSPAHIKSMRVGTDYPAYATGTF